MHLCTTHSVKSVWIQIRLVSVLTECFLRFAFNVQVALFKCEFGLKHLSQSGKSTRCILVGKQIHIRIKTDQAEFHQHIDEQVCFVFRDNLRVSVCGEMA